MAEPQRQRDDGHGTCVVNQADSTSAIEERYASFRVNEAFDNFHQRYFLGR